MFSPFLLEWRGELYVPISVETALSFAATSDLLPFRELFIPSPTGSETRKVKSRRSLGTARMWEAEEGQMPVADLVDLWS